MIFRNVFSKAAANLRKAQPWASNLRINIVVQSIKREIQIAKEANESAFQTFVSVLGWFEIKNRRGK
jgi:hypothetical protein